MNYFQLIVNSLSLVLLGIAIGCIIATRLIKLENKRRTKKYSTYYSLRAFTVSKNRTYGSCYSSYNDNCNYFWFEVKEPGLPDTKIFMSKPEWDKFTDGQILYMTIPYEA